MKIRIRKLSDLIKKNIQKKIVIRKPVAQSYVFGEDADLDNLRTSVNITKILRRKK